MRVAMLFLLGVASTSPQESIEGCGGFVSPSADIARSGVASGADLSSVKVQLLTSSGMVKYEEACAPNGYYYIPMYDKGHFVIKVIGPEGWTFSPSEVQVNTAAEDCPCLNQKDINLHITGFAISGRVLSAGADSGPRGVTLTLSSGGTEVGSTVSADGGVFSFDGVLPGKYEVKASHPSWHVSGKPAAVTVGMASARLADAFVIDGYAVEGAVASDGQPMTGVSVFLYSGGGTTAAPSCTPPPKGAGPRKGEDALCLAMSDESGTYRIGAVPAGEYFLVPQYISGQQSSVFEISPAEQRIRVDHDSLRVPLRFELLGFSIPGRVVGATGGGIGGVSVLVDGQKRATTAADGSFLLDKVRSGTYTIEAAKENILFYAIENLQVLPSMASLPDLKVSGYKVCGRIVTQAGGGGGARAVVLKPAGESGTEQRVQTSAAGEFCFEAAAGEYAVVAPVTDSELRQGFVLTPPKHSVTVSTQPVLGLVFSQSAVVVSGVVKCIAAGCDDGAIVVSLAAADSGQQPQRASVSAGKFEFRPVVPGSYRLAASRAGWCWKAPHKELTVATDNIDGLVLEQRGYELLVQSDLALKVEVSAADGGKASKHELVAGDSTVCLEAAGRYSVRATHECYEFSSPTQEFNTDVLKPVRWEPVHTRLSGTVVVKAPVGDEALTVSVGDAEASVELVSAGLWRWTHWAKLGAPVTVTPRSATLLFSPLNATVAVTTTRGGECPGDIGAFRGTVGRFLKGSVTPAMAGVRIAALARGSDAMLLEVFTDETGVYRAGPLYEDAEVVLVASHDGFHFKGDSAGNFKAVQLGQVSVRVVDETGGALGGVLLSLSGHGYRNNNGTNMDGEMLFGNLFEGKYFIRALLKEYVFVPASKELEISEAANVQVEFVGRRMAYSVFGTVRSLNGEPEKFCAVEAITDDGKYEETVSGPQGEFRLRGLVPGSKYRVRVKSGEANPRLERALPAETTVAMGERDERGVQFIAFRRLTKCDVSGQVNAPEHVRSTLTVQLAVAEKPEHVIASTQMGVVNYFEFPALARGQQYILKLKSSLPSRQYTIVAPPVPVTTTSVHTHLQLNFSATLRGSAEDTKDVSGFYVLLLTVAALSATIYHKATMQLFERAMTSVTTAAAAERERPERAEKEPKGKASKSSKGK